MYFMTYQHLLDGVEYVLRAQNFPSRISQYDLQKKLPEDEVSERWLAKHKLTGETFLLKRVPRQPVNDPVRELALNEVKVL